MFSKLVNTPKIWVNQCRAQNMCVKIMASNPHPTYGLQIQSFNPHNSYDVKRVNEFHIRIERKNLKDADLRNYDWGIGQMFCSARCERNYNKTVK